MRSLAVIILVVGVAFVPCLVQGACSCFYPAYKPDPSNPSNYIVCDNCVEKVLTCPNGLIWNNTKQSCVWKTCEGGEGGGVTSGPGTGTGTTGGSTASTAGPGSECTDGQYTSGSESCKYKVCENGKYIDRKCPDGLLWNDAVKACDWPCNAGNGNGTGVTPPPGPGTTSNPGTGGTASPGCGECDTGSYAAVDGEACKFKVCDNGCWSTLKCPDSLIWDQNAKACKWQTCANCQCSS
ncbi:unnamed protein product [Hermetia illucens]|uniref:Chitin-binding type-2 domain-containing protein n=1 Tax=Hermetia illucens TaxID=343691 RepID=A0A7R8UH38_HERIL|nr:chondroitin proteoglycan-2-like isoform X1 [Hermetia illucens]CAD7080498.1 unnamed protein product [Hermetia illucens]